MAKFKEGDEVYFANPDPEFKSETGADPEDFMNRVLIIRKVDSSDVPYYINDVRHFCFKEEELVLAKIYNSPLYQALK